MSDALITLDAVDFSYLDRQVLKQVELSLHPGERVALVGDNGAGKSTLLRLMVGLHPVDAGRIIAFGKPRTTEQAFHEVRARIGLLFQDPDDQLFCPTVLEDVAFGPLNLGKSTTEAEAIAHETLDQLGLSHFSERITHKLSGGEKRLVSLATVLAMQPEALLLDEPTNGLDSKTEERLINHLQQLPQAMLFISHDKKFIERLATRAVVLQDGRLMDAVMHKHPHSHTHSHVHIHTPDGQGEHNHQAAVPEHKDHHTG